MLSKMFPVSNTSINQPALADGNCAYNAFVLFLRDCFLTTPSNNADIIRYTELLNTQLMKQFGTTRSTQETLDLFANLTTQGLDDLQKKLAQVLRQMVVEAMSDSQKRYGYDLSLLLMDPETSPAPTEEFVPPLSELEVRIPTLIVKKPTLIQYGDDYWFYGNSYGNTWKTQKLDSQKMHALVQESNIDFIKIGVLPNPLSIKICDYIASINVHTHEYRHILLENLLVMMNENPLSLLLPHRDTFYIHDFIGSKWWRIREESPKDIVQQKNAMEKWWLDTGFMAYMQAIAQSATDADDTPRWGADPELDMLGKIFRVKLHLSWAGRGDFYVGFEDDPNCRVANLNISGAHWSYCGQQRPIPQIGRMTVFQQVVLKTEKHVPFVKPNNVEPQSAKLTFSRITHDLIRDIANLKELTINEHNISEYMPQLIKSQTLQSLNLINTNNRCGNTIDYLAELIAKNTPLQVIDSRYKAVLALYYPSSIIRFTEALKLNTHIKKLYLVIDPLYSDYSDEGILNCFVDALSVNHSLTELTISRRFGDQVKFNRDHPLRKLLNRNNGGLLFPGDLGVSGQSVFNSLNTPIAGKARIPHPILRINTPVAVS